MDKATVLNLSRGATSPTVGMQKPTAGLEPADRKFSHFDPGLSAPFKSALPAMLQIKSQYAEENGALPDLDFTKPGAI